MTRVYDNERRNYNNHPRAGLGNVNSYLVAGTPFLTGAATIATTAQHKIVFPRVAREVVIVNKAAPDLRVYFTDKDIFKKIIKKSKNKNKIIKKNKKSRFKPQKYSSQTLWIIRLNNFIKFLYFQFCYSRIS